MDRRNQLRQLGLRNMIVADMRNHNVCGKRD